MVNVPCFIGIDVAKAQLDIAIRPSGERWAVPNDASGVTMLVDRVQALQPTLIVLEATGGLERAATVALATAGLPVVVVNPRQVRDFARATGQLAKTDAWMPAPWPTLPTSSARRHGPCLTPRRRSCAPF
jgi:transposase